MSSNDRAPRKADYEALFRSAGRDGAVAAVNRVKDVEALDRHGLTLLGVAAWYGLRDACEQILARGARLDATNAKGATALAYGLDSLSTHARVAGSEVKGAVDFLIEQGADVRIADSEGRTALHHALASGSMELVDAILERGARVDTKTSWGETPLMRAAAHADLAVVTKLLSLGANLDPKDSSGKNVLYHAAQASRNAVCDALLAAGASIDTTNTLTARTLSMAAVCAHHLALLQRCIIAKVDLDARDHQGVTALQLACLLGDGHVVDLLLTAGASPDLADAAGSAPIHHAAKRGDAAIVQRLIAGGGNARLRDKKRREPVALTGNPEVQAILVAAGATPPQPESCAPDATGRTPLMRACANRDVDAAKNALMRGDDVNARDKWGKTALLILLSRSSYGDREHTIFGLLAMNPKLDVRLASTKTKQTPLHVVLDSLSKSFDHEVVPIVAALLERGADPDARDAKGRTPRSTHCSDEIRALMERVSMRANSKG